MFPVNTALLHLTGGHGRCKIISVISTRSACPWPGYWLATRRRPDLGTVIFECRRWGETCGEPAGNGDNIPETIGNLWAALWKVTP
jgi:hypothetical protein